MSSLAAKRQRPSKQRRVGPHQKPGPQPKRPGELKKSLQIQLYECDFDRFHDLSKRLAKKNNAETLVYLLEMEEKMRHVEDDGNGATSTPVRGKRRQVEEDEVMDFEAADPGDSEDADHRSFQAEEEVGIAEDDPGADIYEFVEEGEDPDGDDDEWRMQRKRFGFTSYHERSLNVSDHHGQLLGETQRSSTASGTQNSDPKQYDFSQSPRLLPEDYYTAFSDGMYCKVHISKKTLDNDTAGVPRDPSKIRKFVSSLEVAQAKRYIVELSELVKLISPKCYRSGCLDLNDFSSLEVKRRGAVCVLTIYCKGPHRHKKVWTSSRRLQHRNDNRSVFYALNTLFPAAAVISGSSFRKLDVFFRALNLRGVSTKTMQEVQRLIVVPSVMDAYHKSQAMISESLQNQNMQVVLASDGQFDSPGKCALYCTVANMIVATVQRMPNGVEKTENSAYIASVEVVEKRHTDGKSSPMEIAATLRALMQTNLHLGVEIKELVTDQNLSLLKLLSLPRTDPEQFVTTAMKLLRHFPDAAERQYHVLLCMVCHDIRHVLDVWHRAKNIGKALMKLSVPKAERDNYYKWIQKAKNHFFWCSQNANGNEMKFRAHWLSILHHCQGQHEWPFGRCEHPIPHVRGAEEPSYLDSSQKSFQNICKVITDPKLLRDIPRYLSFRQTSAIESFNSLALEYAPKRNVFGWIGFTIRKVLAALDWNNNVHRPIKRDKKSNDAIYRVRYSKRAKRQIARPEKEPNLYEHVPHLLARCLYERGTTTARFHSKNGRHGLDIASDPRKLAPNTAPFQESREEVVKRHRQMTRMGHTHLATASPVSSTPAEESDTDSDIEGYSETTTVSEINSECSLSDDD